MNGLALGAGMQMGPLVTAFVGRLTQIAAILYCPQQVVLQAIVVLKIYAYVIPLFLCA